MTSRNLVSTADNDIRYVPDDVVGSAEKGFSGKAHESRYCWVAERIDLRGRSVLDFGCGSGYGAAYLAARAGRVLGIDISQAAIDYAGAVYAAPNCSFLQADLTAAELPRAVDQRFDVIVSFDVIEHVERFWAFMANIRTLLKPDGVLVFGCPNRLATFDYNDRWNPFHVQEFTPHQLHWLAASHFAEVELLGQDFAEDRERERHLVQPEPAKVHLKRFLKALAPGLNASLQRRKQERRARRSAAEPEPAPPATAPALNFSRAGVVFNAIDLASAPACRRPFGLVAICRGPRAAAAAPEAT